MTTVRLISRVDVLEQLLAAVAAVPEGVKLSIPALRDALVSQADVLAGLETLVAAGELERSTLRPRPGDMVETDLAEAVEAVPVPESFVAERPPTGAELADRLAEHCTLHGLSLGRAMRHLRVASCAQLRQHQPRQTTIARFTAFFDAPPPPELALRRAGGPRIPDVGGVTGAELAAKLEALIAEHGLSRTRVGLRVYGNRDGVSVLRQTNPRRATVDHILAFLADPPIEALKPRDAWAARRAKQAAKPPLEAAAGPAAARCPAAAGPKRALAPDRPSFEEQLGRVERGEVGIAPNLKFGRPDPAGTLGGVTGEINL